MFAKNLEYLLIECCVGSDVSPINPVDFAERFDSLRRYRSLPAGRENRERHLTATEIAAAILGLAPSNPKWAGHAATILQNLRPVGGPDASFHGAINLITAIERLITDSNARAEVLSITISAAESGTNTNGMAVFAYRQYGRHRNTSFCSSSAVSLLQPGAESTFKPSRFHVRVSKCVVFSRTFFDRVADAVARAASDPSPPTGDGSEYDAEEAQQARYRSLGVRQGSRFLNIGVDTQVTWPEKEMLIEFDQYHLVLMPKTKDNTQSIHIDLHANRLSQQEANTVINRFLSLLAWCDDQFAITQGGWAGNPVPVAVPKRDLAFATAHYWIFDRKIPQSDEARRALALYREGRNAEEAALASYAVLSYFKIIEIQYKTGEGVKKWIRKNFGFISESRTADDGITHFLAACGTTSPEEYIYTACRLAVAHASVKRPSDSDDADEISRLYSASYVLRMLARRFIANEMHVSDRTYSGN